MIERNGTGANDYKWKQLIDYSENIRVTKALPGLCENSYHKGLLEWRLSTESVVHFLSRLQNDKYIEISYAKFSNEPLITINKILDFLEIANDPSVTNFVDTTISRKTSNLASRTPTEIETKLGGKLLPWSADNTVNGLSHISLS